MSKKLSPPPKPPKAGKKLTVPKNHHLEFRPWRKDPKTGRILYAAAYGFKAWPMIVPD
jgi:hypothetical protein